MQYQRTARENIGYGQAEELGDQARVEQAAQEGGSAPLVEALAARYDVVLDGGRVLEEGTHDELMARGGEYARMFALQAQGYQ